MNLNFSMMMTKSDTEINAKCHNLLLSDIICLIDKVEKIAAVWYYLFSYSSCLIAHSHDYEEAPAVQ